MIKHLHFGDNLEVLRNRDVIHGESVDLIYLDPPFNSKADYNVIFGDRQSKTTPQAQITAFEDTWHWNEDSAKTLQELYDINGDLAELLDLLVRRLGHNDLSAYLVMMSARLIELHRVLKPTGSLYLHCDPTASHYLKIILDVIFDAKNFRNEIIWKRTSAHSDSKTCGNTHDVLLLYSKSQKFLWNKQYQDYDESYIQSHYRRVDENGRRYRTGDLTAMGLSGGGYTYEWNGVTKLWRLPPEKMQELHDQGRVHYTKNGTAEYIRYLDEMPGLPLQDVWDDISPVNSQAKERLGYPTQKPLSLLERIILASSNENDIILDPFCGCGTAIHAAEKLNRQWIGIDITHLAISLIENRLKESFPGIQFEVFGTPKDLASAKDLAKRDKYQFQWWACSLVDVAPYQGKKKGADTGIDGMKYIADMENGKEIKRKIILSVKGGENIGVAMVRDLLGTMQANKADIGLFVTLTQPTKAMLTEATKAGFYRAGNGKDYPKLQIFTIEDLLSGKKTPEYLDLSQGNLTFRKATKEKEIVNQPNLFDHD
jgi:site-specific DNA-methyltransferase (adenine-specific)